MTKFYVFPYRYECDNAIMLKNRLNGSRIKLEGSNYQNKPDHVIINWGHSGCPFTGPRVLNQPSNVALAVHKLRAFDILRGAGVPTVPTTTKKEIADFWLSQGKRVIGRKLIKSNNGKGIVWYDGNNAEGVKFWSLFIPSWEEFRVNVYRGQPVSVRVKRKLQGFADNEIKSGTNGYVFRPATEYNDEQQMALVTGAAKATSALGLDFAGVDMLVDNENNIRVIEVNTAPELQGAAMDRLANYIKADFQ